MIWGFEMKIGEWVSVKDRLPTDGREYLIAYTFGSDGWMKFFNTAHFNLVDEHPHFDYEGFHEMRVLFWMEIPPLPEDEE
jgi:hypothetical protein